MSLLAGRISKNATAIRDGSPDKVLMYLNVTKIHGLFKKAIRKVLTFCMLVYAIGNGL